MEHVNVILNLEANVTGDNLTTPPDLGGRTKISIVQAIAIALTAGTTANCANKIWADTDVVTGGSFKDIDLDAALDGLGVALDLDELKVLLIHNKSDAAMTIGAAASNPLAIFSEPISDVHLLPVGGLYLLAIQGAGIAVAAGSCELRISAAGSGNKEFDIIVAGVKNA